MDERAAESLRAFAENAAPGLIGLERRALLEQVEQRYGELQAAMTWFLDAGRRGDAIAVARPLAQFWTGTGRLDEGCEWFARVLGTGGGDDVDRGRCCFEAGLLAFWKGDDDLAAAYHREALELGRRSGDPTVTALALTGLARIALRTDVDEARRLCEEACEATNGTDDRWGRSNAVHVLGVAAQMSGDLVRARDLMSERIELAPELGSYGGLAGEAANLSVVERQLGNLDRAEELSREALAIAIRREDEWMFPYLLNGLAAIDAERGAFERAATLIGAAEAMMATQDAAWPPDERPHYERTVAMLEASLGPGEFERVRARGGALASRSAVDYALAVS